MTILDIFKREDIPEELPDLALDRIEIRPVSIGLENAPKEKEVVPVLTLQKEEDNVSKEMKEVQEIKKIVVKEESKEEKPAVSVEEEELNQKSFFSSLQEDLSKELEDVDKLENWYENKFLPQDIVSNMRQYWENQKTNSVLKVFGKNFKERINETTKGLQLLEKEWQNLYFDLIEKEEEIKDREEELKKLLSEFVEVCKRKKKELENGDNGQRKEKKAKKKLPN